MAQEADAAETPKQQDGSSKPLLPRQPGDDVTTELTDPITVSDEKKTESLAAYMEGIAAQKNGQLDDALKAFRRAVEADPTAAEPVRAHALLLMRLGRTRQAVEEAQKAIELDPDDFETRIQLAVLMLTRRDPAAAARLIEEALGSARLSRASREFVSIHAVRGRLYIQVGDASKAAESYSVLLDALERPEDFGLDFREHQKLMTDRATGYDTIGKVMLEVGRNDKAVQAFSALVRINEDRPGDYHYWQALAQYRLDDLEASEKNLNRYFETNDRSRESLRLLSDLYRASSRSADVIPRLEQLAENTNDAGAVKLFMGDLLVEKGDADAAAKVYQGVIDQTGDADAWLGLIRVAIVKRDPAELQLSVLKALRARIQIAELLPLRPLITNDPEFGRQVLTTAVESLKDDTVEQNPVATFFYSQLAGADYLDLPELEGILLQATLDQNPTPDVGIEAMGRLGLNQYMQENYQDAVTTFRRLLSIPGLPDNEQVITLYRLSAAEAENQNFEEAIAAIETALKLRPQNPQLMYQLGLIQLQAKKYDDSEETLKAAIKVSESDPRLEGQNRILLGGLYSQLGRWDDAIAVYQGLLEMPGITEELVRRGRMALSNAFVQKGDLVNGEKILEEVYAETPDDPGVNNDLGYLYADQNKNLEQAEKMVRIAVDAEPDNPAYLDSLGWVLYRLGRYDEALQALKKATGDPDYRDSTILEHLGDVQKALKQDDDARRSWQEAQDIEKASKAPDDTILKRLKTKLAPAEDPAGDSVP